MKKFRLFATLLVVALCATTIFTSCRNDDDDENPLVGTVWVGEWNDGYGVTTITFSTENSGVWQDVEGFGKYTETFNYTFIYTFNDPIITISLVHDSGYIDTFVGEIRGSTMTLRVLDENTVFTKQ